MEEKNLKYYISLIYCLKHLRTSMKKKIRARQMVWWVECLPYKHEDLNKILALNKTARRGSIHGHIQSLNTGSGRKEDPRGSSAANLHKTPSFRINILLTHKAKWLRKTLLHPLQTSTSMYMTDFTCKHIYPHMHAYIHNHMEHTHREKKKPGVYAKSGY